MVSEWSRHSLHDVWAFPLILTFSLGEKEREATPRVVSAGWLHAQLGRGRERRQWGKATKVREGGTMQKGRGQGMPWMTGMCTDGKRGEWGVGSGEWGA